MRKLTLYSTLGCHLCEQAQSVLHASRFCKLLEVKEVDIAESEAWVEQYGIRIPVLKDEETQSELGWPFDVEQLDLWLKECGI